MDLQQLLGLGVGLLLLGLFLVLFVSAWFLYWGACLAGIERRSFGRAFLANFLCVVGGGVTSVLLGAFPVAQILVCLFLSFILIKTVFATSFGRAVIAWLMQIVVAALIAGALVLGSLLLAAYAS